MEIDRTISYTSISSQLECSICLSLIVEPVSICCGHSFCKMCLVKSLRTHKKKCPTCRSICHANAEEAPVNSMLKNLAFTVDAELYAKRLQVHEAEKANWEAVLPIFYYNDPLFPQGNLSLHLFEPRYKLMMQRIVNTSRTFAYVPNLDTYDTQVGDVALRANLKEVEFLPDGRCLLEARLEGRYRILEHYVEEGTQGLHYCRMECFGDLPVDEAAKAEVHALFNEGHQICDSLLQGAVKQKIEAYHGLPPRCVEAFSLWLCGICITDSAVKMAMLREQDTLKRLRLGMQSLRVLATRIGACSRARCPQQSAAPTPETASMDMDHDSATSSGGSSIDSGDISSAVI